MWDVESFKGILSLQYCLFWLSMLWCSSLIQCEVKALSADEYCALMFYVLGYVDDVVALISDTVEDMTRRLTAIADGAKEHADMNVSMPKTFTQHVHKRDKLTVTEAEAKSAEKKYKFKCDFRPRRFKIRIYY